MKIEDLRQTLQTRTKDDLENIIVEMYKAMPKKFREDKEIHLMIEDMSAYKKKRNTQKQPVVSFETVKKDVQTFIKHAYAQNYIAPNRIISKKERSGWRFTAKKIINQVTAYSNHPIHSKHSLALYEEMYELLCYASGHYVFASEEPFQTLKIEQPDFLKRIILWKKRLQEPEEWITESLQLILDNDVEREIVPDNLLAVFLDVLDNAPLKERMIEIAKDFVQEIQDKSDSGLTSEEENEVNLLVNLIFQAETLLGEMETAIRYFQGNYIADEEVKLYIILRKMLYSHSVDEWLAVYESALAENIKPRQTLKNTYNYIREKKRLPEYILPF